MTAFSLRDLAKGLVGADENAVGIIRTALCHWRRRWAKPAIGIRIVARIRDARPSSDVWPAGM
jgi:hypothetical protein